MKATSISTILRAGALAALFVVGTSAAANADTFVAFGTQGDFNGGGNVILFGPDGTGGESALLTYLPNLVGGAIVPDGGSTNGNFGNFDLTYLGGGFPANFSGPTVSIPFTLTINQLLPSLGSGDFDGTLSSPLTGTIVGSFTSNLELVWTTQEITIGNVKYHLDDVSINHPGNNNGRTSLQGDISMVPEPATMMLLGTGLLAAFRARRKSA